MGTIPRPKGFPIEGKKHMKELNKNTTSARGVFFPQVTQDDTLSVSLGAIRKTDTSNRDASLL
jgi:hypothetical protein